MTAQTYDLLWLIPVAPLVGATVNAFFGKRLSAAVGPWISHVIAVAAMLVAFGTTVHAFTVLRALPGDVEPALLDPLYTWLRIGSLDLGVEFLFDRLSAVMCLVVTGIGTLIHIYAAGYMHGDKSYYRFFTYLNLFAFSMLVLVLGASLPLLFVGWEGVGLCSYLLIGFWFEEKKNAVAGMKAFVTNRIGDFGFVIGLFTLFWGLEQIGHPTLDFRAMREVAGGLVGLDVFGMSLPFFVCLMLFVGATGKSAQIPLYVWLPDAMAGPTPVSALIHAATMVTAGVYMIGRLSFLYVLAPSALDVVAVVGAATALFAATIGTTQNDIKKVLAYSTVSQLGYMFLAMGVMAFSAGIFHLMTHAFFKALLFLGSGSVIHAMHHEQDMRKMGGLWRHLPATFLTFLIGTIAIAGIPPFAGFFSKDEILWKTYESGHVGLWAVGAVAAALTAFYMTRLLIMTFFGSFRGDHHTRDHLHESPVSMVGPLVVLAAGSVVVGFLGMPPWFSDYASSMPARAAEVLELEAGRPAENFFHHWLEPALAEAPHGGDHATGHGGEHPASPGHGEPDAGHGAGDAHGAPHAALPAVGQGPLLAAASPASIPVLAASAAHGGHDLALEKRMAGMSVLIALVGIAFAVIFYGIAPSIPAGFVRRFPGIHRLVDEKYFVDELYQASFINGALGLSRLLAWFDATVIDGIVNGVARVTVWVARFDAAFDQLVVDGIVNGVARVFARLGDGVTRVQTGRVQGYLAGLVFAVMAVIVVQALTQ